jgi:hypothetical protein
MIRTILLCVAVGVATVLLHQEGLRRLERVAARVEHVGRHARWVMLAAVLGIFGLHLLEIGIYAGAYAVAADLLHLGHLVGDVTGSDLEFVYFSAETYTSLGFGDIVPEGVMRLLASFEPLNGLILLGWSASFIHVEVQRNWPRGITVVGRTGGMGPMPPRRLPRRPKRYRATPHH